MIDRSAVVTETRLDRKLIWSGGGSVRYLVVRLQAEQSLSIDPRRARRRHNLAFVIDRSRSMAGPALDAAKRFVRVVVDRLDERDCVSLVTFDRRATRVIEGVRLDVPGQNRIKAALAKIGPGEGSDLFEGWLEGAESAAQLMIEGNRQLSRLFIISDGRSPDATRRINELELHARELCERGIPTTALAIGPDARLAPMIALDDRRGTWLVATDNVDDLARLAMSEYLEVAPVVARDIGISITAPVTSVQPIDNLNEPRQADTAFSNFGELRVGGQKSIVFQLTCPSGSVGQTIRVSGSASWTDPLTGAPVDRKLKTQTLKFARGAQNTPQPRDHFATTVVANAWKSAILCEVLRLNTINEISRAETLIERELGHFERYCRGINSAEREFNQLMVALKVIHEPWNRNDNRERAIRGLLSRPTGQWEPDDQVGEF